MLVWMAQRSVVPGGLERCAAAVSGAGAWSGAVPGHVARARAILSVAPLAERDGPPFAASPDPPMDLLNVTFDPRRPDRGTKCMPHMLNVSRFVSAAPNDTLCRSTAPHPGATPSPPAPRLSTVAPALAIRRHSSRPASGGVLGDVPEPRLRSCRCQAPPVTTLGVAVPTKETTSPLVVTASWRVGLLSLATGVYELVRRARSVRARLGSV